MRRWLGQLVSKCLSLEVSPRDIADLQQAVSIIGEEVATIKTAINRIERKVYRDNGKGSPDDPAIAAAFQPAEAEAFNWDKLQPGDPVPDNIPV